jgi:hypothetical protein
MAVKPDPDGMNSLRVQWAQQAIDAFRAACRTDAEDAVADMLCDVMHWCSVNGYDFEHELVVETSE